MKKQFKLRHDVFTLLLALAFTVVGCLYDMGIERMTCFVLAAGFLLLGEVQAIANGLKDYLNDD